MSRTGHHWEVRDTPTYSNDRRSDWSYDASGNVLTTDYGWMVHSYNAAGQENLYDESGFEGIDTGFLYENTILSGLIARAFGQTHEGAHQARRFAKTDADDYPKHLSNNYQNNYKIWQACFSDIAPVRWTGASLPPN
jgi:hypothetical protein